jgi:dihydroorotate dehydrogenase (fumarate)
MRRKGFQTAGELRGKLSAPDITHRAAYERASYVTAMRAANAGGYAPW